MTGGTVNIIPYGFDGGKQFLSEKMTADDSSNPDAVLRHTIKNAYESLECFLIADPGNAVKEDIWSIDQMTPELEKFIEHTQRICENLFSLEINVKKISGHSMSCNNSYVYFVETFKALTTSANQLISMYETHKGTTRSQ